MNLFLSAYNIFTQLSTLPVHKLLPWSLFLTSLLWKIQSCLCRLRRVHVAEGTTLYSQLLFRIAEVQGQAIQEVLGSSTGLQEQHCSCLTGFRRDILPRCSQTTALWFLLQCCSDHFFFFFFLIEHFAMETTEMKFWAIKSVKQQNYYKLQNYISVLISQLPSNAKLTYLNLSSLYITENNIYIYLHRHLYIKLRKNHYLSE